MDYFKNRSWMYRRTEGPQIGASPDFVAGVQTFLNFAYEHPSHILKNEIRCPCIKCKLKKYQPRSTVEYHLVRYGFKAKYDDFWWAHGEQRIPLAAQVRNEDNSVYRVDQMVYDAAGPSFASEERREEPITPDAKEFFDMLEKSKEPLWKGCKKHTVLSAIALLLNLKSDLGISNEGFERLLDAIKSFMPDDENLPSSLYYSKKLVKRLRLGYQKIEACENDCILFYAEKAQLMHCDQCGHARYKPTKEGVSTKNVKRIPYKILRYFPITDRLQRMYMSPRTAEHMTWHARPSGKEGELKHPADGEAWKEFDKKYPEYALEPRNVRLGLSTDGFNPFGNSANPRTCWPVFLTPYNLPPWMCMKQQYLFLTLIIPGPNSPGKNLSVYLRPLIDELKRLWTVGVQSWDVSVRATFTLRANLMWTISDFPAYGMLAGWSTHGKLACPYCMEQTKSFTLKNGRKPCWFDCHRCLLPVDHPFRRNKDNFRKGEVDHDVFIPFSGQQIYDRVDKLPSDPADIGRLDTGFGVTNNWTGKSCFWELPYWPDNLIRHNLDVMHVEKNVFDNVFNTVMDIKKKTKDNGNARLDMAEICKRPSLELFTDRDGILRQPKAKYTLSDSEVTIVCKWIKSLKLPDGYASNIARCVKNDKFQGGMKSHDCHVFMERLLPIAFRDFLEKPIWEALTELSHFFRDICSKTLDEQHMRELEKNIIEITCKLEKIFPPGFFDSMEHLPVHLPYEARVGGPVYFRWMYPFERMMYYLKKKVRNRACVEGSIAEAYSSDEISMFMSDYFPEEVLTNASRVPRHDDGGDVELNGRLSVFGQSGRAYGQSQRIVLSELHLHVAHTYILVNCPEMDPFLRLFEDELKANQPSISAKDIEQKRDADFAHWLKAKALEEGDSIPPNVKDLALGPNSYQESYNGFKVNGWEFHTKAYGGGKSTTNTGVCVVGDCVDELGRAFYGELDAIVQITYKGKFGGSINLFQCRWFDTEKGLKVDRHRIIDIDHHRSSYANAPFVLPTQASQVYYTRSPCKKRGRPPADWHTVIHTPARHRVHLVNVDDEVYQDETFQSSSIVDVESDVDDNLDLVEDGVEANIVELQALDIPDIEELLIDPESDVEDVGEEDGYESPIDDDSDRDNDEF